MTTDEHNNNASPVTQDSGPVADEPVPSRTELIADIASVCLPQCIAAMRVTLLESRLTETVDGIGALAADLAWAAAKRLVELEENSAAAEAGIHSVQRNKSEHPSPTPIGRAREMLRQRKTL